MFPSKSPLRAFSDEASADVNETVVNYVLDKINMATNEGESSLRGNPIQELMFCIAQVSIS
jgi:hypothetical protein